MDYNNDELYKELYFYMFNAVTDTLDMLRKADFSSARIRLIRAQQYCEEVYISRED